MYSNVKITKKHTTKIVEYDIGYLAKKPILPKHSSTDNVDQLDVLLGCDGCH